MSGQKRAWPCGEPTCNGDLASPCRLSSLNLLYSPSSTARVYPTFIETRVGKRRTRKTKLSPGEPEKLIEKEDPTCLTDQFRYAMRTGPDFDRLPALNLSGSGVH